MDFLPGAYEFSELAFVGVGEYICAELGESGPIIYKEEEVDAFAHLSVLYLIADGESLGDLSLLDRVLDRCKARVVSVIVVNSQRPELLMAMRHKFSCAYCFGREDDPSDRLKRLCGFLRHMNTSEQLLELDEAELRGIFDGARLIEQVTLSCRADGAFSGSSGGLAGLGADTSGALICVFASEKERDSDKLYRLIEQLMTLISAERHRALVWNIYRSPEVREGSLRLDILRTKPARNLEPPRTMENLRAANQPN